MFQMLGRIPWIFLLIIYLVVTHQMNINLDGPAGYGFMALGMVVLLIEFAKSGDVSVVSFMLDTTFAVAALVASTTLLSYLFFSLGESPTFFHWFGYSIVLGDALLSPTNAFRTALRNFGSPVQ